MKKTLVLMALAAVLVMGCSQRFVMYKGGRAYYFASRQQGITKMICDSGDLARILKRTTSIPEATRKELYAGSCVKPSPEATEKTYESLTPKQREELRQSFRAEGYEINYFPCG